MTDYMTYQEGLDHLSPSVADIVADADALAETGDHGDNAAAAALYEIAADRTYNETRETYFNLRALQLGQPGGEV